jgi:hypothetical protein
MNGNVLKTMESLERNGMGSVFFNTAHEAVDYLMSAIPENSSVGIGGSVTVNSIGIVERLKKRGNEVLFHWLASSPAESMKIRHKALSADIYLAGTNALTMDGKLVNIDGMGNRVAGMFFGPPKVYIICGINKIVENVDMGLERIGDNAYLNAERLKLNTPCIKAKKCVKCSVPDRMCNITVIINKKPMAADIEVVIIGEKLGY